MKISRRARLPVAFLCAVTCAVTAILVTNRPADAVGRRDVVLVVAAATAPERPLGVRGRVIADRVRDESYGDRCADAASSWMGVRWRDEVPWRINTNGIPAYLGDTRTVHAAVTGGAANVARGRNECGLPEDLALGQRFVGGTDRRPGIRSDGTCSGRDGRNTIAFGVLDGGLLALTCIWYRRGRNGGTMVEADILISDAADLFFVTRPEPCSRRWDLEGTLTHEFGHLFGLGHVSYVEHGTLTMSDGLPACSTAARSLGLGDYLPLRQHYRS